jgi:non-ribosomal peptide synthetase-like protein
MPVFPSFVLIDWFDEPAAALAAGRGCADPAGALLRAGLPRQRGADRADRAGVGGIRWGVLPRLKPGRFAVHSNTYCRQMAGQPHPGIEPERPARDLRHRVRAVLVPPARRQGGRDAEISTALGVVPDMLTLGDETFIADAVMLGDEQIDGGWMTMQPTVISHRSFVGNGSYIPDGTVLPERVLIGVHTHAPATPDEKRRHLARLAADPPAGARGSERLSRVADLPPSPLRRLGRGWSKASASSRRTRW